MQFIKSLNVKSLNYKRPITHTTKLLIKQLYSSNPDKESDCAVHCLPECPQVNAEPIECHTLNEMCEVKCSGYNKYSFNDLLIQAVSYIETQPSNKEYFEPKGSLDKQIQVENKTK